MAKKQPSENKVHEFWTKFGTCIEEEALKALGNEEQVVGRMREIAKQMSPASPPEEVDALDRETLRNVIAKMCYEFPPALVLLTAPDDQLGSPEFEARIAKFKDWDPQYEDEDENGE